MRAVLLPDNQNIALWVSLLVLVGAIGLFGAIGVRGFMRRALD
jgi:ABC-2 type transport system permease protein